MISCKLPNRTSFTALALILGVAASACGHFDDATADGDVDPQSPDSDAGGPKAPPVTGTPDEGTITEAYGVFVAASGDDSADGSRAHPLATLQMAITSAGRIGKIVFVCSGKYPESIVLSDSISIIGGLDCSTDPTSWKTGGGSSRIESPTSPAVVASSITSPTRLEALTIIAPDATAPGGSSIGLFAQQSPSLTVALSSISASNAASGTNGGDAAQLTLGPNAAGQQTTQPKYYGFIGGGSYPPLGGAPGGTPLCIGADGYTPTAGGLGGEPGLYAGDNSMPSVWRVYGGFGSGDGKAATGNGAPGNDGPDGAIAGEIGGLTTNGYVPLDGHPGQNGTTGSGGNGGHGGSPSDLNAATYNYVATGAGGPGGGAGGCPGLAGGVGTGGGASLGIALIDSPVVLDSVTITSANGGAAGHGSLGSDPTPGGAAGIRYYSTGDAVPGGRGGEPGVSTNGSNGPSVGTLYSGAAPKLTGSTKATAGRGAPAIDAVSHNDGFVTRTIPATPAGVTADIKSL